MLCTHALTPPFLLLDFSPLLQTVHRLAMLDAQAVTAAEAAHPTDSAGILRVAKVAREAATQAVAASSNNGGDENKTGDDDDAAAKAAAAWSAGTGGGGSSGDQGRGGGGSGKGSSGGGGSGGGSGGKGSSGGGGGGGSGVEEMAANHAALEDLRAQIVQELKRKVHREAKACEVCEVTTTVNSQQCLQKPFVTPSVSHPVLPPVSVLSDISSTLSSFSPTFFLSLSVCVCVFRQQHQNEQLGHGAAEGVGVKNAILRGGAGSLRGAVRRKDEV